MTIYTSYYARLKTLRENGVVPVAISRGIPHWFGKDGVRFQMLAPTRQIMNLPESEYIPKFNELLSNLDPKQTIDLIKAQVGDKDCALLCYEKPGDFCHRHLVADWLNSNLGMNVKEWVAPVKEQKVKPTGRSQPTIGLF